LNLIEVILAQGSTVDGWPASLSQAGAEGPKVRELRLDWTGR
jgi:hypothetical protein